ncbi:hypothetical protein FRAHR75_870002 [Frankia sp. Hr75.2]|nr:hypothetical protein FRAHR75_870002 [Frankia sp. Hr75.2]SQD98678.1 hypothetical protein FMEAI12_4850035 [Parafrankia sp. Ea1.12]
MGFHVGAAAFGVLYRNLGALAGLWHRHGDRGDSRQRTG